MGARQRKASNASETPSHLRASIYKTLLLITDYLSWQTYRPVRTTLPKYVTQEGQKIPDQKTRFGIRLRLPPSSFTGCLTSPRHFSLFFLMATVRAGLNNRKYTASPDLGDALIDTRDPSRGESGFERRQRLTPSPSGTDHVKVTMQTKIAVRDKTPHRFQVVPLRDARKHSPTVVPKDATPVASARSRLKSTGYQLSGSRAVRSS